MTAKKIDPAKATPQAPRGLRAGTQARAAESEPPKPKGDVEDGDGDDEDDKDDDESDSDDGEEDEYGVEQHEPLRAAAEEAHAKAAEAYGACKGTDSAAALMHADDMGDAAVDAHNAAKASSEKMRGVEAAPDSARPAPPPSAAPAPAAPAASAAAVARAVVAVAGPSADAQLELVAAATFGRRMRALFGGVSFDEAEGFARAAHQDAGEAIGLRAAAAKDARAAERRKVKDADAALRAELRAAVRAGKYARAEVFDVAEVTRDGKAVEILTPQAWLRDMPPAARAAMIAKKQARAGAGAILPDETTLSVPAHVAEWCRLRNYTPEQTAVFAAKFSQNAQAAGASPAPESM